VYDGEIVCKMRGMVSLRFISFRLWINEWPDKNSTDGGFPGCR
jgi:hypothetical protein